MAILSSSVDSYDVSTKNRIVNALLIIIRRFLDYMYEFQEELKGQMYKRSIKQVDVQNKCINSCCAVNRKSRCTTSHQTSGCTQGYFFYCPDDFDLSFALDSHKADSARICAQLFLQIDSIYYNRLLPYSYNGCFPIRRRGANPVL